MSTFKLQPAVRPGGSIRGRVIPPDAPPAAGGRTGPDTILVPAPRNLRVLSVTISGGFSTTMQVLLDRAWGLFSIPSWSVQESPGAFIAEVSGFGTNQVNLEWTDMIVTGSHVRIDEQTPGVRTLYGGYVESGIYVAL